SDPTSYPPLLLGGAAIEQGLLKDACQQSKLIQLICSPRFFQRWNTQCGHSEVGSSHEAPMLSRVAAAGRYNGSTLTHNRSLLRVFVDGRGRESDTEQFRRASRPCTQISSRCAA